MDWEDIKTKEGFNEFMKKYYPNGDLSDILTAIAKYIKGPRRGD